MYMLIYAAALRTFWRISRNAKKCRGWVQILSTHQMNENLIKQKGETGRCKLAPTCLALPLYQGVSRRETQKKYTGYCIIACVPMWLRGKDLNQRPPGYRFAPPCGARKTVRAFADPPVFRPLRIRHLPFFCHRQRAGALSQRAPLAGLITRKTWARICPENDKTQPTQWGGLCFSVLCARKRYLRSSITL